MPLLANEDIRHFLRNINDQLENERILNENRIIDAAHRWAEEKNICVDQCEEKIYAQQWMIRNLPQLQSDKAAMQDHFEKIMIEKFDYYNKSKNQVALLVWVTAMLKNIGFTDQDADLFMNQLSDIGKMLDKKAKASLIKSSIL
jgi:hypothetical protein